MPALPDKEGRLICVRLFGPHILLVHAHAFPHAPRRRSSPFRRGRGGRVQNLVAADREVWIGRISLCVGRGGRGRDGGQRSRRSSTHVVAYRHGGKGERVVVEEGRWGEERPRFTWEKNGRKYVGI